MIGTIKRSRGRIIKVFACCGTKFGCYSECTRKPFKGIKHENGLERHNTEERGGSRL